MINGSSILLRLVLITIILCLVIGGKAQLCNGSLGDPVVNITFDANGTGYAPPNAYTYISSSCPNDGFYTITGGTTGCFDNTWHNINSDHTGKGAFMLINASFEPGDFFVAKVADLCPNTNYQFASWIMNVLNKSGIRPNITFTIRAENGDTLGKYSTGDIPETLQPTWKEYGFYFTTQPGNAEIVLSMTNNAPGGIGNDLALDDITFRPCGPAITAAIKDNNTDTVNVCDGNINTYTFTAKVSSDYTSPLYQWQVSVDTGKTWQNIPNATTLSYQRLPTVLGSYAYRLTVIEQRLAAISSCRIASNAVVINVHPNPLVNAGPDRILIAGTPVTLNASVTGEFPSYNWAPSSYLNSDTLLTPLASPPTDMEYLLTATSSYGCFNKDETNVKVVAGIFVPDAFTPNGDGKNDHWRIPFLDPLLNARVNIYNRYGQVIYSVTGNVVDWDGTFNSIPQPAGAYVYFIHFNAVYPDIKGTLMLIR